MKYRSEIDGLRALAVIPVILFHAGFKTFGGGFVGVDVFFVISGYLITSLLLNDLQAGNFSIVHFYERRARRILPALFVVMLACLPFAWFWLLPQDMRSFAQSLVAVSVFASNVLFWRISGYFDEATELKPLVHTWSLSVEEQYYLLFPLLLFLAWRFCRRWIAPLLAVIAVISITLAQYYSLKNPSLDFYLLPTRAWELMIGALVALYYTDDNIKKHRPVYSQLFSLVGISLITYSIFAYSYQTPFPSFYALAPTVGTALIIVFSTKDTLVGKVLSNRLFVGVGLISYSAYLWHQPMLAFARQRSLDEPSRMLMGALALASLPLAYLTWRFVERPFRNKNLFTRMQVFKFGITCSIFFITFGLLFHQRQLKTSVELFYPALFNKPIQYSQFPSTDCSGLFSGKIDTCKVIGTGPKTVVVWGDSHAEMLSWTAPSIDGVKLYVVTHSGCPPVIGVRRFDNVGNGLNCNRTSVITSYASTIKQLKPDFVILVGRWTLYLNGWQRLGVLQKAHHFLSTSDKDSDIVNLSQRESMLQAQLQQTIRFFSDNSTVVLVSQPPDYSSFGFRRLSISEFTAPADKVYGWHEGESEVIANLQRTSKFIYVDPKRLFCKGGTCYTRNSAKDLLYLDDNHLSPLAIIQLWEYILDQAKIASFCDIHPPAPITPVVSSEKLTTSKSGTGANANSCQ